MLALNSMKSLLARQSTKVLPLIAKTSSLSYHGASVTSINHKRMYSTENTTGRPSMLNAKVELSSSLANTLGVTGTLTRPETTRALWAYIKANDLQDPNDGRQIINDAAFKEIFETDTMSMFEMTK
jgi:chromatin remodeling complex protein RSC6